MDISTWQGKISVANYQKAMNAGIKYVILRVGFTGSDSKKPTLDNVFENNYANAIKAGLPVGIYYYSLATTVAKAKEEAQWVVNKLKGLNITYPVYIDMEDPTYQSKCSKTTLANVCNAFCKVVTDAGHTAGVYASLSWFNNKIGAITAKHEKWVAQYYKECQYKGDYSMWQYSSSESVPGIDDKTDVNWCYKEFSPSPQPEPTPAKKKYQGEFPNLKVLMTSANQQVKSGIVKWCKKIVADGSYHYVKWTSDPLTHKCAVCHPEKYAKNKKYKGWQCIGFATAALKHGGTIPVSCSCSGTCNDGYGTKMFKNPKKALSLWKSYKKNGNDWVLIYNNGKKIPESMLKPGDTLLHSDTKDYKTFKHQTIKGEKGYLYHASGGTKPIAKAKFPLSSRPCIMALRYTGKGTFKDIYRYYLQSGDKGDEVRKMQDFLLWAGYDLGSYGADANFGASTEKAVRAFQKDNKLTVDGKFGTDCLAKAKEIER